MKESLYIVMPAYNEEENIRTVVDQWYPMLDYGSEESRLVIADGGSKDNTLSILLKLKKDHPKLIVFSKPGTDHGTKVLFLYRYAVKRQADWIFQTDSDGQTDPAEFPAFWELRNSYDAILGNRRKREDGFDRKVVEQFLKVFLFLFFGTYVPDANAPFRLMRASVVNKYLRLMWKNFDLPNAVLAASFSRYHEAVAYREITFRSRQKGKNYMNLKRVFLIGIGSVRNFLIIRFRMSQFEKDCKI